ncbi:hypothetical protein, partial [Actinomadura physcomitrii]|uniref:hypothetical protein n=1 Tax=Actinomadura physcomitrii TaxID=2650748 RepID=UPI001A9C9D6E
MTGICEWKAAIEGEYFLASWAGRPIGRPFLNMFHIGFLVDAGGGPFDCWLSWLVAEGGGGVA